MKKFMTCTLTFLLTMILCIGCSTVKETPKDISAIALKGATAMGLVGFMNDIESGETFQHNYNISMTASIDEVTAMLAKGEVDIAAIPANLASVLYNNTDGAIQTVALNTLGVLYLLENGDTLTEIEDLRGKTILASGKGATPEMALRFILTQNNIDPDHDVTIEWKSEQSEVLAHLTTTDGAIAMMPEPFVTTAIMKNENIQIQLDLTEEWNKTQTEKEEKSNLITGVMVARTAFIEENPDAMEDFLTHYKKSVDFVNDDLEAAATLIGNYEITPYETALIAIPNCNIVCITGEEMKTALSGYLSVLFEQNPAAIGGTMPEDNFYYEK